MIIQNLPLHVLNGKSTWFLGSKSLHRILHESFFAPNDFEQFFEVGPGMRKVLLFSIATTVLRLQTLQTSRQSCHLFLTLPLPRVVSFVRLCCLVLRHA